jgi:hypothetical protein
MPFLPGALAPHGGTTARHVPTLISTEISQEQSRARVLP